jgi:hypothetical protein
MAELQPMARAARLPHPITFFCISSCISSGTPRSAIIILDACQAVSSLTIHRV